MLNISPHNHIREEIPTEKYSAFQTVINPRLAFSIAAYLLGVLLIFIVILFLPWTQNINAKGKVTALRADHRPQQVESAIAGRIEEWYVVEGDTVAQGDTILFLSEIKDAYFDPQLIARTQEQIDAKESSSSAYLNKAGALSQQMEALRSNQKVKLEQAGNKLAQTKLKVRADSVDLIAAVVADSIAALQLTRWETLFAQDLKSRTDLEKMKKERQEVQAKVISQRYKLDQARAEYQTSLIELDRLLSEFKEKIAKAESDRQSALSNHYDTEAQVSKMENSLSNYSLRTQYRYIIAPQPGLVQKALKTGIGETIKEGEAVVTIVPLQRDLAASIFVRPIDLPLMKKGEEVRLVFDGWPSLIFASGWPGPAIGTFGGRVYAIDSDISPNGLYRILVVPDVNQYDWPEGIRIGAGVNAFALLNDVPVWYEIWRQLNGFPPRYYEVEDKALPTPPKAKK